MQRLNDMTRKVKEIVKKVLRVLVKIAVRYGLVPKEVIIVMDGGICSQMHFYLMGEMFRQRGHAVSFDTSWFASCGKDLTGKFDRNLDLLKIFPYLPWRERTNDTVVSLYRRFFQHRNDYFLDELTTWTDKTAPCYLSGYYHDPESMYHELFHDTFHIDPSILDNCNRKILKIIQAAGNASTAIHVRRGDLAGYHPSYGNPATHSYFVRAIEEVAKIGNNPVLFIFSDEPEWCKTNLIKSLPYSENATIIDINGSDRGYMDMILMAHCNNIITSKGSLGKYAAMLRPDNQTERVVTLCDEPDSTIWLTRIPGSVALPL